MYLKSLRVKGFKSFAKQTELVFEPGVAVVIGPNGSGKSNLSEAVVWALGEQSPTNVRGSSMQDVIFAGSDGRRAAAQAEVELTFDNTDGALPLPMSEVAISRRVGRDGESAYAINRTACRLTDVVELMAGIGLGKELHSIVSQGKVESFLQSKPEDRRALIEEAAGLGRFKRRRERAELKLREVHRNLERVEVMEREVATQLTPLRRQASAAEQLRTVEGEIAELRGRLLVGQLEELDAHVTERRHELEGLEGERGALTAGLAEIGAQRAAEEEAFTREVEERERRARRVVRARVLTGRLESCRRLSEQRGRLLEEVQSAAQGERARLLAGLAGGSSRLSAGDWPSEEQALVEALGAGEQEHTLQASALAAARQHLGERRSAVSAAVVDNENTQARAQRLRERAQTVAEESARLASEVERLEAASGDAAASLVSAQQESEKTETALAKAEAAHRQASSEHESAASEAATAADHANELLARRQSLSAQIEHLEAGLRELQDVGEEVLAVARDYPGAVALSSVVSCTAGYERALAAALAQLPGALAVPHGVDQWSLLQALRHAGVTLVRLVLPSRAHDRATFPGAVPLLDKVSVDDEGGLADALGDVVIVDDLQTVPVDFAGLAVTRDGAYYRPREGQLGLAAGVPAALLLDRRAAHDRLRSELDVIQSQEVREKAVAARQRAVADQAAQKLARADAHVREAREKAAAARRELSRVETRAHEADALIERARRESAALAAENADFEGQLRELSAHAAQALLEVERQGEPLAAAEAEVAAAEGAYEAALAAVTRARVELEERRAAASRAEKQRAGAEARLKELDRRLQVVPEARSLCAGLSAVLSALCVRGEGLVERLAESSSENSGLDRAVMRELADREAALRHDGETLAERHTQAQVEVARLQDRRRELAAQFEEVASRLEIAHFEPPADEAEAAALAAHGQRLERRREGIGPVNPLAEAECAELGERASFLREQRRDLEKSTADLLELIAELTARVDADFTETFAAVEEKFAEMTAILFPDGRGRLALVEGDDGAAGVAVEVKPARKLGKKLQLLSGGERALVAIAFLMALVLAHPCPFYILDEVEAALDDINIGRFVSLVRQFRERTQFVLITHQKRTMEAADVLYGVTMGPDGASRVVSARMAEEEIARETQAKARA